MQYRDRQNQGMNESIQLRRPTNQPAPHQRKSKYGNMVVLTQSPCLITIGPDYWCFLPTFIIFCTVSYFMIKFVLENSENLYFRLATIIICGGMCFSYLLIATSNPGIVTEQTFLQVEEQQPMNESTMGRKRLCRKCNIMVKRNTQHCADCDVCVTDYDHHCPWTSKCIGGGNIVRFYIFLGMVPIFLIYVFVAFATLMSALALQASTAHIQNIRSN